MVCVKNSSASPSKLSSTRSRRDFKINFPLDFSFHLNKDKVSWFCVVMRNMVKEGDMKNRITPASRLSSKTKKNFWIALNTSSAGKKLHDHWFWGVFQGASYSKENRTGNYWAKCECVYGIDIHCRSLYCVLK